MSLDMFLRVFTVGDLNRDNPVYSLCYISKPCLKPPWGGIVRKRVPEGGHGPGGRRGEADMCSDEVWIS